VFASLRSGFRTLRADLKTAGVTWLVWLVIQTCWPLAMIPILLVLVSLGVFLGGIPSLITAGVTSLFTTGSELPAILAVVSGLITFMLILFLPMTLLGGLREVFTSSMWTLTYRENRTKGAAQSAPTPETPVLEAPQAA
jgi:hypothetical protein